MLIANRVSVNDRDNTVIGNNITSSDKLPHAVDQLMALILTLQRVTFSLINKFCFQKH